MTSGVGQAAAVQYHAVMHDGRPRRTQAPAIRLEVVTPDQVMSPMVFTDSRILDDLLDLARDTISQLEECGPEASEVARWLRVKVGELIVHRINARERNACYGS